MSCRHRLIHHLLLDLDDERGLEGSEEMKTKRDILVRTPMGEPVYAPGGVAALPVL